MSNLIPRRRRVLAMLATLSAAIVLFTPTAADAATCVRSVPVYQPNYSTEVWYEPVLVERTSYVPVTYISGYTNTPVTTWGYFPYQVADYTRYWFHTNRYHNRYYSWTESCSGSDGHPDCGGGHGTIYDGHSTTWRNVQTGSHTEWRYGSQTTYERTPIYDTRYELRTTSSIEWVRRTSTVRVYPDTLIGYTTEYYYCADPASPPPAYTPPPYTPPPYTPPPYTPPASTPPASTPPATPSPTPSPTRSGDVNPT